MSEISALEHDPPPSQRETQRLIWLSLAIALPPLLWTLQLLMLSAFANYACMPGSQPLPGIPHSMVWLPLLEYLTDAAALTLTFASGWISLRYRAMARQSAKRQFGAASARHLNRLCFMALGGILSAAGFLTAIIFETIASVMVPPCAG